MYPSYKSVHHSHFVRWSVFPPNLVRFPTKTGILVGKTDHMTCINQWESWIFLPKLFLMGKQTSFGRKQITWQNGCDVHLCRGVHQFWCTMMWQNHCHSISHGVSVMYNSSKLMYHSSPSDCCGTLNFESLYITDTPWEMLWQLVM